MQDCCDWLRINDAWASKCSKYAIRVTQRRGAGFLERPSTRLLTQKGFVAMATQTLQTYLSRSAEQRCVSPKHARSIALCGRPTELGSVPWRSSVLSRVPLALR